MTRLYENSGPKPSTISETSFAIWLSVSVTVVREFKSRCLAPGPFAAQFVNEEMPVPPAIDPDPTNNVAVFDIAGECEAPPPAAAWLCPPGLHDRVSPRPRLSDQPQFARLRPAPVVGSPPE